MSKLDIAKLEDIGDVKEFVYSKLFDYINPLLEYRSGSFVGTGIPLSIASDLFPIFGIFTNVTARLAPVIWHIGLSGISIDISGNYYENAILGPDVNNRSDIKVGTNEIVNGVGDTIHYVIVGE